MAINGCELKVIEYLLQSLRQRLNRRPRVLMLGYPDVLATEETFANLGLSIAWAALNKRSDGREVWKGHGRDLGDYPMCESRAIIEALAADCIVVDAIRWGGEDHVLDLNLPLPSRLKAQLGTFDLIVDPGTVEHCFNIAQAFLNVHELAAPLGYIYHQSAVAFPNHGFWSLSPTAFFDFYEARNYVLGAPAIWLGTRDQAGFEPVFHRMDPFAPITGLPTPIIGSFVFQRPASDRGIRGDAMYPIQRCYSANSRTPPITDLFAAALPASYRS